MLNYKEVAPIVEEPALNITLFNIQERVPDCVWYACQGFVQLNKDKGYDFPKTFNGQIVKKALKTGTAISLGNNWVIRFDDTLKFYYYFADLSQKRMEVYYDE